MAMYLGNDTLAVSGQNTMAMYWAKTMALYLGKLSWFCSWAEYQSSVFGQNTMAQHLGKDTMAAYMC